MCPLYGDVLLCVPYKDLSLYVSLICICSYMHLSLYASLTWSWHICIMELTLAYTIAY